MKRVTIRTDEEVALVLSIPTIMKYNLKLAQMLIQLTIPLPTPVGVDLAVTW